MLISKPVIGIANQKGGVGKTTTAKILLEYFALLLNKKVLGIDFDPQYSLTARYLGIHKNPVTDTKEPPIHPDFNPNDPEQSNWDGKSSIANIFFGEPVIPYSTRIKNLYIGASDEAKLTKIADIKRSEMAEKVHHQLLKFLSLEDLQNDYDAFVIDTPPAKEHLTIAAVKAMTHLIIPLEMEIQALEGLQGFLTLWKQEALQRPADYPLHLLGVLPSKYHSRRSDDEKVYNDVKDMIGKDLLMPTKLVDRAQYPQVDLRNMSIFELPNSDPAKQECLQLGKFIKERVFQ